MKSHELLEVIGEAQDNYLLDAKVSKKKTAPVWVKWAAMAACLILIFGLMIPKVFPLDPNNGGIVGPGGTVPIHTPGQRPISAYIQHDISNVLVTHINAGEIKSWTVSGTDLDVLRSWTNNLQYEILSADAENPGNLNGNEIYRIEISEGDYPGFSYIIDGTSHYLEIEGYWYLVSNPSYPPITQPAE